ncbi:MULTISPECIES: hypothetical protein [Cyanophyceae]|jgi:hypothetical protein|nr:MULTISPECIES: hypothetical protein [Cyanophyceae]
MYTENQLKSVLDGIVKLTEAIAVHDQLNLDGTFHLEGLPE